MDRYAAIQELNAMTLDRHTEQGIDESRNVRRMAYREALQTAREHPELNWDVALIEIKEALAL